jgi:hypothetical protein
MPEREAPHFVSSFALVSFFLRWERLLESLVFIPLVLLLVLPFFIYFMVNGVGRVPGHSFGDELGKKLLFSCFSFCRGWAFCFF